MTSSYIGTYQISDLENELIGMLHGTSLSQIQNEFGAYNRAARRVLDDVDPQETKMVSQFGKVYNGIFDYPVQTDLKGNKIIDFFPAANRTLLDNYKQNYNKDFDLFKNYRLQPDFTMKYSGAVRTIRLNATNLVAGTQINAADGPTTNGSWITGGGASAVAQNSLFFTDGVAGSVQCQLNAGSTTGYLENSTMSALDLTQNYQNNADQFFWIYIPDVTAVTAVELRFGSSASNYYVLSAINTDFLGNSWVNGWNCIKVPFTGITTVGTPVISKINYIRVTFTYNSTLQQQILINQFYSRIGVIFNDEYYSKYLFRDGTTNVFKEKVTSSNDYVNLDTDAYNLLLFASGGELVQQQQGLDALFYDANQFEQRYQSALANYKQKYKSEILKPGTLYYKVKSSSYRRYFGQNYKNY